MKNGHQKENTAQQYYGNVILIHSTPATVITTTTTTSESSSLDTTSLRVTNKGPEHQKPSSKSSSIASYLGRLLTIVKPKQAFLDNKKSLPVNYVPERDTANRRWWQGFRKKKVGNQQFLWCFRPVVSNAESQKQPLFWTTFEKKNQIKLTKQFDRFSHGAVHDSCKLQDTKIFGGKMVVTVMLKEGMAFVLDPEWSEPITYEITWLPKLNWYQRMRAMHDYKRIIKRQQKQQQQQ